MATSATFAINIVGNLAQFRTAMEQGVQVARGAATRIGAAFVTAGRTITGGVSGMNRAFSSFAASASGAAALMSVFARNNEDLQRKLEVTSLGLIGASAAARLLGSAVRFALTPIGLIVTALGSAVAVATQWEGISRFVVDSSMRIWATLGDFFQRLWGGIAQTAQGLKNVLAGAFSFDEATVQRGVVEMQAGMAKLQAAGVQAGQGVSAGFQAAMDIVSGLLKGTDKVEEMLITLDGVTKTARQMGQEQARFADAFAHTLGPVEDNAKAWEEWGKHVESVNEVTADFNRQGAEGIIRSREETERTIKSVDDFIATLERQRTSLRLTGEAQAIYNALGQAGAEISEAQREKIEALAGGIHRLEESLKRQQEVASTVAGAIDSAFSRVGDTLVDMAVRGKDAWKDFGNVARGVLTSLLNEMVQKAFIKPLATGVGNLVGSFFGPTQIAPGTVGIGTGGTAFQAQHGGIFLPRTGGHFVNLAEAGQAEAVIPLSRMGEFGGGGGVKVEIINNAPGVQVRPAGRSRGPDGREVHRLIVESMRGAIAGGELDRAMGLRFGATPRVDGR